MVLSVPEDPVPSFPQLIDQVAEGLAMALTINENDITRVLNSEILATSPIQQATYDYYYGSPYKVIADIRKEIKEIVKKVEERVEEIIDLAESNSIKAPSADIVIEYLLKVLATKPIMIKILTMTKDVDIWINSLCWLVKHYANCWKKYSANEQVYLYRNFCSQFSYMLDKWEKTRFSLEWLPVCIKFIEIWLEDDEMVGQLIKVLNITK